MSELSDAKVYWLAGSEIDKEYDLATFYRCFGIEDFIKKVEAQGNEIVGITFEDNNLGFVLKNKK